MLKYSGEGFSSAACGAGAGAGAGDEAEGIGEEEGSAIALATVVVAGAGAGLALDGFNCCSRACTLSCCCLTGCGKIALSERFLPSLHRERLFAGIIRVVGAPDCAFQGHAQTLLP